VLIIHIDFNIIQNENAISEKVPSKKKYCNKLISTLKPFDLEPLSVVTLSSHATKRDLITLYMSSDDVLVPVFQKVRSARLDWRLTDE